MWNFNFVVPSFLLLTVIICHYFATPRLNVRLNRTFLTLLLLETLTLLADVVSSRADEKFPAVGAGTLYALNMAFFVCYLYRAYLFFVIVWEVLRLKPKQSRFGAAPCKLPFLLCEGITLSSFATGAVFSIGENGYQRGPLYDVLYVCWFFYLLLSAVLLVRYHTRLGRYAFYSALGFNGILFAGNIARILLPRYLIMNTFCLLAIMTIYLAFENPDLYLADRRLAFNMRAFREKLDDLMEQKRSWQLLAFAIQDYIDTREIYGGSQMDRGVDAISLYLRRTFPGCQVYYLRTGRFALLFPRSVSREDMRRTIEARFRLPWEADDAELYLSVAFVQTGSDERMESSDRIANSVVSALERASLAADGIIDLSNAEELDRQTEIKRALERALDHDQMEVFLQPLVDSQTRTLAGAEALCRIRDAEGRIIPPSLFVPIAEKNGKINLMGEQVLRKTCRFVQKTNLKTMGLLWINVNLSPIQCMRRDLSDRFLDILRENGVPPEIIHLEITEQSVSDIPMLERHIRTLHENGFLFSLDDYGSGYSNLSRVKHYPFANIKLDMEVVWDYYHDRDHLLPNIVQAFKQMGYSVTAEGIETAEMADVMAEIGCDYLQGYYFSRPIPAEEFLERYGNVG